MYRGNSCRQGFFTWNELVPLLLPCGGIFIGGPDNREALAYATCMSNQQSAVAVTVVRIVLQKKKECTNEEQEMEVSLDDSVTEDFKLKIVGNALAVWHEIEVEEEDEVISAIRSVEGHYDLVMVGRRRSWDVSRRISWRMWSWE